MCTCICVIVSHWTWRISIARRRQKGRLFAFDNRSCSLLWARHRNLCLEHSFCLIEQSRHVQTVEKCLTTWLPSARLGADTDEMTTHDYQRIIRRAGSYASIYFRMYDVVPSGKLTVCYWKMAIYSWSTYKKTVIFQRFWYVYQGNLPFFQGFFHHFPMVSPSFSHGFSNVLDGETFESWLFLRLCRGEQYDDRTGLSTTPLGLFLGTSWNLIDMKWIGIIFGCVSWFDGVCVCVFRFWAFLDIRVYIQYIYIYLFIYLQ